MRTRFVCLLIAGLILTAANVTAGPTINVYTDKGVYQPGDMIEVSLSGSNYGEGMWVSVYLGLLTPQDGLYTLGPLGWSAGILAWIDGIGLPSSFAMGKRGFLLLDVPCSMPPIGPDAGTYNFACVLTRAGTLDWISDLSLAPFRFLATGDFHGGEVSEDMTLSGDITLTSDVLIIQGAVLTIEPPSRIKLAKDVGIFVYGGLIAEGDAPDSIVFQPLGPNEAWKNITFCETAMDEQCRVMHCTVTGGGGVLCDSFDPDRWGGAVLCYRSSPTIQDNSFVANTANMGGAICCRGSSSAVIANNTITGSGNSAGVHGGGIYCETGSAIIANNMITGNSAMYGGAMYCLSGSPTITGNVIGQNSATWYGGGMYICNSSARIVDNTIIGNSCYEEGGGVFCDGGSPAIIQNTISQNVVDGIGGGISCAGSSAVISNNLITGNSVSDEYGGGGGGGLGCRDCDSITITNNTIVGNYARGGGGLWSQVTPFDLPWPAVSDCIIWGNSDDVCGQWSSVTYCCTGVLDVRGEGNIHTDPLFVSGPFGDYYLDPTSPCIDAGSRSAADAGLSDRTTQADGTPDTGVVDMGFHYPIP